MQQHSVIARSIPMEMANFLRGRGEEGVTLEDIAVGINRSEEEVQQHLPEARRIVRRVQAGRA
jgi:DNA-directed RNA polymerase specialized sigma24 family protein